MAGTHIQSGTEVLKGVDRRDLQKDTSSRRASTQSGTPMGPLQPLTVECAYFCDLKSPVCASQPETGCPKAVT